MTQKEPDVTGDRRAVAAFLAEHGATPSDEAVLQLGWTSQRWWAVIHRSDDWFALGGDGWVLTDIGRIELARESDPGDGG
jgi:hypothetical protein